MGWFSGSKGKYKQQSTLNKSQQPLHEQLVNAGLNPGAGGAFGDVADYYRNNLSDNPADFNAFAAPQLRQFNEEIIPDLSEQFAGMGAGGLSSSGFRNAAVNAGTDLSERLGAIRANLRQQSAQGLQNLGQQGLNPVVENVYEAGQPGFASNIAPAVGAAAGSLLGPAGTAIGGALGGMASNWLGGKTAMGGNKVGKNSSWMGTPNQWNQTQNVMNAQR
jgi:hypothetical protein